MKYRLVIIIFFLITCKIWGQFTGWEVVGEMPFPVHGGEAVATDSVIYILGGYSDISGSPTDLIQSYNPYTNIWRIVGKMQEKRMGFVALKFNDKIIIYGGLLPDDSTSAVLQIISIKPDSITFYNDTTLRINRLYSSGVLKDSTLIIIGGNTDFDRGSPVDSSSYIFTYNLNGKRAPLNIDSSYQSTDNIPYQQMCALYGNVIYVFGGLYLGVSSWIYEFDYLNVTFEKKNYVLLEPRAGGRAITGNDGKIYLIGGYNENTMANNTSLKSVEIFDIFEQQLYTAAPLRYRRKEFMAARYGDYIYVFGGKGVNDSTVSVVESLKFYEVTTSETNSLKIEGFKLDDCYPNPFNPSTNISFSIPKSGLITLNVYSLLGEKIKTLASGYFSTGKHKVTWDGRDEYGNVAASGLYFYQLSDGANSFTKKAVLLK